MSSFWADEQIFHQCGVSLNAKQLCFKCIPTHWKSVNQGQSHVAVYLDAWELTAVDGDSTRIMYISWMKQGLKSIRSSLNVVLQQQRKDSWVWGSGSGKPWCDGNASWRRVAGAICKGEEALLHSWQNHWNGIDEEGGRTHHPPLLYYFCRKKRTICCRLLVLNWRKLLTRAARIIIAIFKKKFFWLFSQC